MTRPRVLVVTAVPAERDAVLAGRGPDPGPATGDARPATGDARPAAGEARPAAGEAQPARTALAELHAVAGGVGPAAGVAAAAELAIARAAGTGFDAVVCAGVAGGFAGHAGIGDLVVADLVVAADLGASDADGSFLSVDDLGLGQAAVPTDRALADRLAGLLAGAGAPVRRGTVLTVATVTGTRARADELAGRWAPAAEAMEGHPVALAAARFGLPFAEVRAVSNGVGARDRSSWDLPAAFVGLAAVGAALAVLRS